MRWRIHKGIKTYFEPNNSFQIGNRPHDELPHVQKCILQKLLDGNFAAVPTLHFQLWCEHVSAPEACPKCEYICIYAQPDDFCTVQKMVNVRHSSSRELLIAARPQPALVLRMTATPHTLQPSSEMYPQKISSSTNTNQLTWTRLSITENSLLSFAFVSTYRNL